MEPAEHSLETVRKLYIQEADPIGTETSTLINHLSARMVFERTGVRLYDALIAKLSHLDGHADYQQYYPQLSQFRDEELKHFGWLTECITKLGSDPNKMSPEADLNGVISQGLVQVLSDPRTSFMQCLQAMLIAELADNDGWELVMQLCSSLGHNEYAERIRTAIDEERNHLETIRNIYESCVMDQAKMSP